MKKRKHISQKKITVTPTRRTYGWQCQLTETTSDWCQIDPPTPWIYLSLVFDEMRTILYWFLPAGLLTLVLMLIYSLFNHNFNNNFHLLLSELLDPSFWMALLMITAFLGSCITSTYATPMVVAFEFDLDKETLRYSESRFGFKPQHKLINFDQIIAVRPYIFFSSGPADFSESGSFSIQFRENYGHILSINMGYDIPIAELRQHCAWLKQALDDHVQATLQFDNSC